ncbi:acyltransferase family protein [Amycolatopsis rubida]|uniref:Peptidoglycan/LPS O-acetylase OafA/YrhL, contains acyltransferase and SGNH-hydrolase domains n=1 Tax=Amycolatopsis rubida TaxID=112413 RepID=A0A1I5EU43_9PSEU|nr:acyltransferase [Amycolatopsis rubida]SFO14967.1 Peptidoglycan/LPS O-acetylase OafA/YrhL, contains acyltransferase and SGNH-hydrolase domains [Amycolatopsis rubida]
MSTLAEPNSAALAEPSSAPAKKTRIVFIDIGRGLGALLVFYSHIAHPWVIAKNDKAPYVDFIEALTSGPMHMSKQGIGQIAVPFFFLVSGFVVTPIALRQGTGRFALNRFIRVYAPMLFVVALTAFLLLVNLHPPSTGQAQTLNPLTVFTNTTLVNYLIFPQVVLVPVAWTMIVEVIFYLLLMAVLPLLRRWVWLGIAVELTFVFVVMMSRSQFGPSWSLFAVNVSYLPAMLIGQVIWATTKKQIPLWTGALYGGCAWSLYVLADVIDVGRVDSSYNLALAFAVACFLMGMFAEDRLKQRKIWTMLSERSYSIYLLHMLVTFVLLQLLRPAVPLPIALLVVIPAVFGVVELSYRFVERPSHSLARRLSHRPKPPSPAPETPEPPVETPGETTQLVNDAEVTAEIPRIPAEPLPPRRPAPRPRPVQNGRLPRDGAPPPTDTPRAMPPRANGGAHRARPVESAVDRTAEPPVRRAMPPRRRPSAPPELRYQPDQENQAQRGDQDDLPRHRNSFRHTPR